MAIAYSGMAKGQQLMVQGREVMMRQGLELLLPMWENQIESFKNLFVSIWGEVNEWMDDLSLSFFTSE